MCSRIPQPAVPSVQLASNPAQRNAGVTQPLATAAPAVEKKPNRLLQMLGVASDHEPDNVRGNDNELGAASAAPATVTTTDPMLASVRLRASINGQISLGSGTIVDSQPGRTLIVTCGHIFRNRDENTKVEVDLFENGQPQTYVGSIIDVDLAADVGLVSIPTHRVVSSIPRAPATLVLEKAQRVACIGCSGGNDPTREQLSITEVNKYDGPDNIECTGTPVQGRSGGGLFSENQLIGVCIAAVTGDELGVYAHVFAVHDLLDRNQLSHLYQPATVPEGAVLADAASSSAAPADFPAELGAESASPEAAAAMVAATEFTGATAEPATTEATDLAGVMADVSAGDAEVVVIIRSRSNPNAESRVVIINRASPKFLAYLNGENRPEGLTANRTFDPGKATAEFSDSRSADAAGVVQPPRNPPRRSRTVRDARPKLDHSRPRPQSEVLL
jgi:hypothetical protein